MRSKKIPFEYLLFVLFVLSTLLFSDHVLAASDFQLRLLSKNQDIFQKQRELRFSEISHDFKEYKWSNRDDPQLLIIYCEAILETGGDLPKEMKISSASPSKFAQAYFMLLHGKTHDSKLLFDELINSEDGKIFGYVGFLEQSILTGNITSLGQVLENLKTVISNGLQVPLWIAPYYDATYNLNMGQYESVTDILELSKKKKFLTDEVIEEFKITIAIRQNRFAEARTSINRLKSIVGVTQNLILHEAEIMAAELGFAESSIFLEKKMHEYPLMWLVKKAYVNSSLEAIFFNNKLSIPYLNILSELKQKRSFDPDLQLNFANLLFHTDDPFNELTNDKFRQEIRSLDDFVDYDLLLAKLSLRSKQPGKQLEYLNIANEKAPLNVSVLWLSYQIAELNQKYDECIENLNKIRFVEPYNIYALVAEVKINNILGNQKEARSMAHEILNNKNIRKLPTNLQEILNSILQENSDGKPTSTVNVRK